ncbi:MAG TPA: hypothetical protein VKI64_00485 [Acidimicrobiales bacterium]|nr:hypothetical protein [Acidimicrobiales bacterium]
MLAGNPIVLADVILASDAEELQTPSARAVGGVIQGANIRWYLTGGDLARTMSEGFDLLEAGTDQGSIRG